MLAMHRQIFRRAGHNVAGLATWGAPWFPLPT
ncbi:hypothetical protein SAMN05216223_1137 [Actinacidiphila yanglinensis]|uniref:Uncharacterized protein n=1 Tax=Actinacidiphila yanglinensis TaxID=310779 RepID=A0A1H6DAJ5_9ACTN|nr:hypothetical protein SAMN05216223_1137 [Actinacidiphila yanglinensis]